MNVGTTAEGKRIKRVISMRSPSDQCLPIAHYPPPAAKRQTRKRRKNKQAARQPAVAATLEASHTPAERLDALNTLAAVVVSIPTRKARTAARRRHLRSIHALPVGRPCWVCGYFDRPLVWHHAIQLQHGGTNATWNLVRLCEFCHAKIHAWLDGSANVTTVWPPQSDES